MSLADELSINNPIARAELDHLHRATGQPHPALRLMWNTTRFVVAGIAIGFFAFLLSQITDLRNSSDTVLQYVTAFAVFTLLLHFMTIYRASIHASNTFLREKQGGTWEMLLLTDVGSRRLVLGKWWAVICKSWRSFVFLGILRAAVSIGIGVLVFAHEQNLVLWYSNDVPADPVLDACIGGLLVFAFTLMNCLYTAAAGIVGSLLGRINTPAVVTAESVRIGGLIVPIILILTGLIAYWSLQSINTLEGWQMILMWVQLTLLDNGTLLAALAANPLDTMGAAFLPIVLIAFGIYIVLTLILLRLAQWLAHRQGASNHADG